MEYLNLLDIAYVYCSIALFFIIMNSFIAGYKGEVWTWTDIKDSFFWPLSLAVLLGLLVRLIKESLSNEKDNTEHPNKK